ncbi:MAG: MgtC/SapB family protein [Lachnospiraceae bacterium]|nr:MgtC/SapB family protein [Lachnospiraceae bacterium]
MTAALTAYLREFNFVSVALRLILAMLMGAFIGMEPERKGFAAGLRTHMLVCMGASLTMLIAQYDAHMLNTAWAAAAKAYGLRVDVSRYSAQVINGIGFLGAGTIIVSRRQEVHGLTTAAGLWASGCLGIAIGAGFYSCTLLAFLLILLCNVFFYRISRWIVSKSRNMNIYVEFSDPRNLRDILKILKEKGVRIFDVDIDRKKNTGMDGMPGAAIMMQLPNAGMHEHILTQIMELDYVTSAEEV